MPLVFVFVAILFWLTVATVVAVVWLSGAVLHWVASLGHSPRAARR